MPEPSLGSGRSPGGHVTLLQPLNGQEDPGSGLPGGSVVKNPPSNTGDAGSISGWGTKIPHAMGQLSVYAATAESESCNWRA